MSPLTLYIRNMLVNYVYSFFFTMFTLDREPFEWRERILKPKLMTSTKRALS